MKHFFLFALFVVSSFHIQAQWTHNPDTPLKINDNSVRSIEPRVATHPSGISYISYLTESLKPGKGSYDLYLCKLDVSGNKLWERNVLVTDKYSGGTVYHFNLVVTSDQSAVITFYDKNNAGERYNTSVYKINPDGSYAWGKDNVQVTNSSTTNNYPAYVESLSDGSVIVSWVENYAKLYVQRILPDGSYAWAAPKHIPTQKSVLATGLCISGSNDDFFVTYTEQFGLLRYNFCIQKLNKNGDILWSDPAKVHSLGFIRNGSPVPTVLSDGEGGVLSCLASQSLEVTAKSMIHLQQVGADGTLRYPGLGLNVANNTSKHFRSPKIYYYKNREVVFVAWSESSAVQGEFGMGIQRVNMVSDKMEWGPEGKKLRGLINGEQISPEQVSMDSKENILVTYTNNKNSQIATYVKKMDFNAFPVWEDDLLLSRYSNKSMICVSSGNGGQLVTAWKEKDTIYAQQCIVED